MKKKLAFLCAALALTLASCTVPEETVVTTDTPETTVTACETVVTTDCTETFETSEIVTNPVTTRVTTRVEPPKTEEPTETAEPPKTEEPVEFDYKTAELGDYIKLGKYLGIEVFVEPGDMLTEEQLDLELELYVDSLLESAAIFEGVCQVGDNVNIEFVGTLDGEEFFGGDGEGYSLTLGKNEYIIDVDSGIIGMSVGETRTVTATFPNDYGSDEFNGKMAVFDITLNYIYPKLTDEFIAENTEFDSVSSLRMHIKEIAEADRKQILSDASLTKAMANSYIISLPDTEVEKALANTVGANKAMADTLMMSYEDFLMQSYGITETEAESIFTEHAKNEVAQKLLIYAIARDMGMDVSDEVSYDAIRTSVTDALAANANYIETLAN